MNRVVDPYLREIPHINRTILLPCFLPPSPPPSPLPPPPSPLLPPPSHLLPPPSHLLPPPSLLPPPLSHLLPFPLPPPTSSLPSPSSTLVILPSDRESQEGAWGQDYQQRQSACEPIIKHLDFHRLEPNVCTTPCTCSNVEVHLWSHYVIKQ